MKYYLGIDGGGTKTSFTVIDQTAQVVLTQSAGRSSIDTVTTDEAIHVFETFLDTLEMDLDGVFVGLGGVISKFPSKPLYEFFNHHPKTQKAASLTIENDIVSALLSGGFTDSGMAVILGTGSVAYGIHEGQTHRAGGWSFYEGDEGSAYDLGMQAILNTIKVYDQRKAPTPLYTDLMQFIGLHYDKDVPKIAEKYRLNRTETAQLAKWVTQYALKNDPGALEILISKSQLVVEALKTVFDVCEFKKTNCVVVGSLGQAPIYFNQIQTTLNDKKIPIQLILPTMTPDYAGALFALNDKKNNAK